MGIDYFIGFYSGVAYMVIVYAIFPFVKVGIERPYRAVLKWAILRRVARDEEEEAEAYRMLGEWGKDILRGARRRYDR